MSNIFFTSDQHFGHANFIHKYKIRDFIDVDNMNETLINRWNSKVNEGDTVYCLGDFSFASGKETCDIIDRLNGTIHYIRGNHERHLKDFQHKFASVNDLLEIKVPFDGPGSNNGEISIVLCHYAMRTWNKSHRGAFHLYGHSHGDLVDDPKLLSFDVGTDCWNHYPLSFEDVKTVMETKEVYGSGFDFNKLVETQKCPLCYTPFEGESWKPGALFCKQCKRRFE